MHGANGWLLALLVFFGMTLLHALWRGHGEAKPDPIRESGPIY